MSFIYRNFYLFTHLSSVGPFADLSLEAWMHQFACITFASLFTNQHVLLSVYPNVWLCMLSFFDFLVSRPVLASLSLWISLFVHLPNLEFGPLFSLCFIYPFIWLMACVCSSVRLCMPPTAAPFLQIAIQPFDQSSICLTIRFFVRALVRLFATSRICLCILTLYVANVVTNLLYRHTLTGIH